MIEVLGRPLEPLAIAQTWKVETLRPVSVAEVEPGVTVNAAAGAAVAQVVATAVAIA